MKFVAVLGLLALALAQDAAVFLKDGNFFISTDKMDDSAVAWARYTDDLETDGWGKFSVFTNADAADDDKMYGAGFLEGYLTQKRIWESYQNYKDDTLDDFPAESHAAGEWPDRVKTFMKENEEYTRGKSHPGPNDNATFWQHVELQLRIFDGLVAGYNAAAPTDQKMTSFDFWVFNSMGDMDDLSTALFLDYPEHLARMEANADLHSHCTGMVKIVKDKDGVFSEVFTAQDAWSGYSTMSRMLKAYDWKLKNVDAKGTQVVMASYPGVLFSNDDFYITNAKMDIIETTFHCWDNNLYRMYVNSTAGVLTWLRSMVANRLANSGAEWAQWFSIQNSGTYNNQYMVVDHKLFEPGMKPKAGFITIIEQMPGLIMTADRTDDLIRDGFVPSINTPSIIEVFNYAMYPEKIANTTSDPGYWSYNESARMLIMKRDQANIKTYDDFKTFMRYNNYTTDRLCKNDPGESILSRYDLRGTVLPTNYTARAFGGIDSKTTSHWDTLHLRMDVQAGPTTSGNLPAWTFSGWEKAHPDQLVPHRGIPDGPWPKAPITFAFNEFGLGHHMSVWAIVGLVVLAVVLLCVTYWLFWSHKRKKLIPIFNKSLPQPVYDALPQTDPLAAPAAAPVEQQK